MRVRTLFVTALAAIALTGCASPDCASVKDAKQASSSPEPQIFVVPSGERSVGSHEIDSLRCNNGLTSVEVGVGAQTEPNASYVLTETTGNAKNFPNEKSQTGVTIKAKPVMGTQIVSSIVHTVGSSYQELHLSLVSGGIYEASIKTAQYAYLTDFPEDYPISSITFCIKRVG